jgi:multidrug resistance efflux pump
MRGRWLLLSLLAIAAGVGLGALSLRRHRQPPQVLEPRSGAALVAKPELTFSGIVRPQHVVKVGAQVSGNIEAFMADVGDEVFQGQVLARVGAASLDADREAAAHAVEAGRDQVAKAEAMVSSARMEESRANADALRARAALDRAQKTFARQQTLHAAGATPRLVYEKAAQDFEATAHESELMDKAEKAAADNVQNALQTVELAKKTLAERNQELQDSQNAMEAAEVRSPVDGLVVGRKGEAGKPADEAGEDMFQIATDIYALEVTIEPPREVLKRLRPGDPALVVILDLQTGGMPGEVKDVNDREGQAVVEFNSTLPAIKPGMRADVRLKLE